MSESRVVVGVGWQSFSSENLGVAALAESHLALLREAAARTEVALQLLQFCYSETRPSVARARGVELADPMTIVGMLRGSSKCLKQIKQCDVVLDIGEGDSFSDIYGYKRLWLLLLFKFLVLRSGVKLVLSPQTIGPFRSGIARRVSASVMRRASRVFARDQLSMIFLVKNELQSLSVETTDVAFALPYVRAASPTDGRTHVGVNVSGLLFNGGYNRKNQFGLVLNYKELVRELLHRLHAREDIVVHLVAHVISDRMPVEDDYRVCQDLSREFPRTILAPKFDGPSEAKSYISGLHFFTGARMHACIAAFSSGVPVVPMAYSRKFNGLFGSLNYPALVDLRADDGTVALRKTFEALDQREELVRHVANGMAIADQKLNRFREYLCDVFRGIRGNAH